MARGLAIRFGAGCWSCEHRVSTIEPRETLQLLGRSVNVSRDQQTKAAETASAFQNERLKLTKLPDHPIQTDGSYAGADGVWIAEPVGTEISFCNPSRWLSNAQQTRCFQTSTRRENAPKVE